MEDVLRVFKKALKPFLLLPLVDMCLDYLGRYTTNTIVYFREGILYKNGDAWCDYPKFYLITGYYSEEGMLKMLLMGSHQFGVFVMPTCTIRSKWILRYTYLKCNLNCDTLVDVDLAPPIYQGTAIPTVI